MGLSRRLKLVAGLVMLQALALIVVLGITNWASQDMLLRFSEDIAARIARDATAYTDEYLEPANESAEITHRLLETELLDITDRRDMAQYFLEILTVRQDFDGVYFGDERGGFVYVSRPADTEYGPFRVKHIKTSPSREVTLEWYSRGLRLIRREALLRDEYDPRRRPWYRQAFDENDTVWTSPYVFFTSQTPGITVAVPVTDALSGAFQGAVGVDIQIDALSGFLETLDISPRGQAAIVAENGDIIAHSDETHMSMDAPEFNTLESGSDPILARAAAQIEGGLKSLFPGEIRLARFEANGEVWIGAVLRLKLERTPWTVVTYLPETDILDPLYRVRNIALVVSLLALVATAGLGFIYGRSVMR